MSRSLVLLVLFAIPVAAAEPSLKEARTRWLKGNYAEAATAFEGVRKTTRRCNTIGWSRAASQYEYEKPPKPSSSRREGDSDLLARGQFFSLNVDKAADLATDKNRNCARMVKAEPRDRGELKGRLYFAGSSAPTPTQQRL